MQHLLNFCTFKMRSTSTFVYVNPWESFFSLSHSFYLFLFHKESLQVHIETWCVEEKEKSVKERKKSCNENDLCSTSHTTNNIMFAIYILIDKIGWNDFACSLQLQFSFFLFFFACLLFRSASMVKERYLSFPS